MDWERLLKREYPRHQRLLALIAPQLPQDDLGHDIAHVMRVYGWCVRLAREVGADGDLAGACGLVHDLVNVPKNSPDRPLGSEQSAKAAGPWLLEAGYGEGEVGEIVEAVRTCSWSRGLEATAMLGKVLQDADRLDAIGAVGIARMFSCAQRMGGGFLVHPWDVMGEERALDDKRFAADHVKVKLLKLAATMHTQTAKDEAQRRHQRMVQYLDYLQEELAHRDG